MKLTLTQRLSLVFAVLLLICSGTSAWLQVRSNHMHELEVVQGLSRDLAAHIARDTQLMDADGLKPDAVRNLFSQLMLVNPSVEVYLLDIDGRVVGNAAPSTTCCATRSTWRPSGASSRASCCRSSGTTRAASMGARCSAPRPHGRR